jgi:hypothetical protein
VRPNYIKASNSEAEDLFGIGLSISAKVFSVDTLAVGVAAEAESSSALGVNGDGSDNGAEASGAVYLYDLSTLP